MEQFVVSARKYRPTTFDTVVGQTSITTTLTNAIRTGQLAQAYLFCGPRGVGKTTCARIFAKTINLESDQTLGEDDDFSFNLFELDAASNNSVDDIRNLTDQVRIPPQRGKYKVYIIDEVHMLSQAAFNAFLKTLEEPPPHAIFILATTEKHKIIPTILSRCQIFDFHRIQIRDMVRHLQGIAEKEGIQVEEEALQVIAQKADGALRDSLSIFDQIVSFSGKNITYDKVIENLNVLDYDYYFKATDAVLNGGTGDILLLFDAILRKGFDGHNFLNGLASHFRDLLVCKDPATLSLLEVGESTAQRYQQQAGSCDPSLLLEGLKVISRADVQYKSSKNQRLLVEVTLLQLCSLDASAEKKNEQLPGRLAPPRPETSGAPAAQPADRQAPATPPAAPAPPKPAAASPVAAPRPATPPPPAQEASSQAPPPPPAAPLPAAKDQPRPTLRTLPTGGGINTVSISGLMAQEPSAPYGQSDSPAKEEADTEEEIESTEGKPTQIFSENDLIKAWEAYADNLRSKGKTGFASLMMARQPGLEGGTLIKMQLDSSHSIRYLNEEKADLLSFLRHKVNNFSLQLDYELVQSPNERKAYTSEEKFRKLVEKNPNIGELKQRFDLDIER